VRPPRLWDGEVLAVPRLHINLGPGICLTTEENHGKTSVRALCNFLLTILIYMGRWGVGSGRSINLLATDFFFKF
jgi:hypothetical protein